MDSRSASSTTSRCACEDATPPPATMTGRLAPARMRRASRTIAISGSLRKGGTWVKGASTTTSRSASASMITLPVVPCKSRCTGPGAPDVADRKAWRSSRGNCAASVHRSHCTWSRPRRAARGRFPDSGGGTAASECARPVMAMTGDPARYASCSPAARLAAPTFWAIQTPARWAARAYPSAM